MGVFSHPRTSVLTSALVSDAAVKLALQVRFHCFTFCTCTDTVISLKTDATSATFAFERKAICTSKWFQWFAALVPKVARIVTRVKRRGIFTP